MAKLHLSDTSNNPLCRVVYTGKRYETTTDKTQVTCRTCLKELHYGYRGYVLLKAENADTTKA
jgi:hypothetical protein